MNAEKATTLNAEELERALEPLMGLHSILLQAGRSSTDVDSEDVANVLGAILHSAYSRIGHPVRGDIL